MPLTPDRAYGGVDLRVQLAEEERGDLMMLFFLQSDHPGLYPRNPAGKGYQVLPGEVEDLELPNLEDPDDQLTAERLVTLDPRRWYRQPLPWHLDWVDPTTFPRCVFFRPGTDVWFPGPEDRALPEVARGYLAPGFRASMEGRRPEQGPAPRFFQEASAGLVVAGLRGGEPVRLSGVHPERPSLAFSLPPPPRLELSVEGDRQAVVPRLHQLVCRPEEETVTLVYGARRPLPRPFVPGVHARIPVALSVDGGAPIRYVPPSTQKALVEQAAQRDPRQQQQEHP